MKKQYVEIKNEKVEGDRPFFNPFWEGMLREKFTKYGYDQMISGNYEVVKETEKAFQIIVPADEIYRANGSNALEDWKVWMPKKAFMGF